MQRTPFNDGWTCRHLGEPGPGEAVRVPHDAALAEARSATAAGGVNTGWYEAFDYLYEKSFVPTADELAGTCVLEFEGVCRNAEVSLNGESLAFRPYGYTNFYVDLTGKLRADEANKLEVVARNADQPNSRWYSGAGLYRPVALWTGPSERIELNGVRVRTLSLNPPQVEVVVRTNAPGTVAVEALDEGRVLASAEAATEGECAFTLELPGARPWSPESPALYELRVRFGEDEVRESFGLRTLEWGPRGFLLNGERRVLRGACDHHTNGILGAVCDPDAVARKVRLLKAAGYDSIRSAHNPCSKALLAECDRQGMLVMDEYIDHWYIHKTIHDYVEHFDEWWQRDLADMVDKDYNHPCVVLYSIGNEVGETAQPKGIELAGEMTEHLHALDATRPVTCGINIFFNFLTSIGVGQYSDEKAAREAERAERARARGKEAKESSVGSKFFNDMAGKLGDEFMKRMATLPMCDAATKDAFAALDIAGYNYGIYRYRHDLRKYPDRLILGSETFANDAYRFYEQAKGEPRLVGDFVWSGMDYLGEVGVGAWEYADYAPRFDGGLGWASAGSGRLDLTGKPLCESLYTRVAMGLEAGPLIGVRPVDHTGEKHSPSAWKMTNAQASWSWEGCEGRAAEVEVYARAARVELWLNGRKVAERALRGDCIAKMSCAWEPGELEARAFDAAGAEIGRSSLVSAGPETRLSVEPEEAGVAPGHLAFVRLRWTDGAGICKPLEHGRMTVEVEGGELEALGNACPYNEEGYLGSVCSPYFGEALAIVRVGDVGEPVLRAYPEARPSEAVTVRI